MRLEADSPITLRSEDSTPKHYPTMWARLFSPVDIASIVYFRIAFGSILFIEILRFFFKGWIFEHYIRPQFLFSYYGFGWVKPWPGDGMVLHFFALGVLSLFIVFGIRYRLSAVLFFFGFTYVFLLERAHYLNHFYFVCLFSFLLIFIPAHRSFSIDVIRRPKLARNTAPAWCLWVIRLQVGIVYFYGGIAKIEPDWLRGDSLRIWLSTKADYPLIGSYLTTEFMPLFFAYSGLFIDFLIVPLLLWRRTRVIAFVIAIMFNGFNSTLWNIGIFPWLMVAATAMYFAPDWPRRLLEKWWGGVSSGPKAAVSQSRVLTFGQKITAVLLAVFVAFELLFPLRHFLYPGNSDWTDEGDRFAWHMYLRQKYGRATFYVNDPESHYAWEIKPRDYLTTFQAKRMSTQTDMILQFSHFLADRFRRRGYERIEVRTVVFVSLNGRTPQLLVDPQIDLAAETQSLWPAKWILPLKEER